LPAHNSIIFLFVKSQPKFGLNLHPHVNKPIPSPEQSLASTTPVKMSTAELATSYAALILADDGVEITVSDKFEGADARAQQT
jgi:hypothetical protein